MIRVVAVALVIGAAACSDPATTSYECRCDYVTDTDVPGVLDVRVCVGPKDDPAPRAAECAQAQGVGAVSSCKCPQPGEVCSGQVCEQAAARAATSTEK